MARKCELCGRVFEPEQSHFRYCSRECADKARGGGGAPGRSGAQAGREGLPNGYLRGGYFQSVDGKRVLRPEVVDEWAQAVAKVLGAARIPTHQLRLFLNKAMGIGARLDRGAAFVEVVAAIRELKSDAALQVGRDVVGPEFKQFIDLNVEEAVKSAEDFRQGFLVHFQCVYEYYVYYFRGR